MIPLPGGDPPNGAILRAKSDHLRPTSVHKIGENTAKVYGDLDRIVPVGGVRPEDGTGGGRKGHGLLAQSAQRYRWPGHQAEDVSDEALATDPRETGRRSKLYRNCEGIGGGFSDALGDLVDVGFVGDG